MRLRGSWIETWLKNPPAIMPYTTMPAFWDGGDGTLIPAVDGVLDNDPERQIRAVRKYVQEMGINSYPPALPKNN